MALHIALHGNTMQDYARLRKYDLMIFNVAQAVVLVVDSEGWALRPRYLALCWAIWTQTGSYLAVARTKQTKQTATSW